MNINALLAELSFKPSRSSGSGGQHVNKVETRMSLLLDLVHSTALDTKEIERIKQACPRRVNKMGVFQMHCDSKRTQLANKKELERRFILLITEVLTPEKKRIKRAIPASVKAERLKKKKIQSERKQQRRFRPSND